MDKTQKITDQLFKMVYKKGDLDLLLKLDRVIDRETEDEMANALRVVINEVNEKIIAKRELSK